MVELIRDLSAEELDVAGLRYKKPRGRFSDFFLEPRLDRPQRKSRWLEWLSFVGLSIVFLSLVWLLMNYLKTVTTGLWYSWLAYVIPPISWFIIAVLVFYLMSRPHKEDLFVAECPTEELTEACTIYYEA